MRQTFFKALCIVLISTVAIVYYNCYDDYRFTQILESDIEVLSRAENDNYRYPNKQGNARFCNLFVYVNIETGMTFTTEDENTTLEGDLSWIKTDVQGLKDRCPNRGDGCNPYSCQQVPY